MLQFSTTLCTTTARLSPRLCWRFAALFTTNPTAVASESPNVTTKDKVDSSESDQEAKQKSNVNAEVKGNETMNFKKLKKMVQSGVNQESVINDRIQSAESLNDLLDVLKLPNVSQENNLKIMSSITKLVNSGNADISDIQKDARFLNLQRKIGNIGNLKQHSMNTEPEFVRYTHLSVPAIIQVISNLAAKKNRDTPLLRFLSQNIVEHSETLNIGQCANLLYSTAVLNYLDEDLLEKIFADLLLADISVKPNTIESIVTSMGILRYKNERFLYYLCECLLKSKVSLKPDRLMSILLTFATLGYASEITDAVIQQFMLPIKQDASNGPDKWLDFAWSLVILNKAQNVHLASVLEDNFIKRLKVTKTVKSTAKILKLLNINAATQFAVQDYNGPTVKSNTPLFDVKLTRTKQKEMYITALSEALKGLLPSTSHFKMNIDTGMGFMLDGLFYMDSNFQPIPVDDDSINTPGVTRIALLMHDYNDYCRGKSDLLGIIHFHNRALKAKGYHVLNVSYKYFSPEDKLVKRVNYLKECIETIQEQPSV